MSGTLEKALAKTVGDLLALLPEAEAFLKREGASADAVSRALVVLEEMVLNLVKYSTDSVTQEIHIRLEVSADRVLIEVVDDGTPFDPREAPKFDKTTPLEQRQTGGMGIEIVRSMARRIDYERLAGRNHLRVVLANP